MTDMTYDPEADAVYIRVGAGKVENTEEAGPFIYDLDQHGRILGNRDPECDQGARAGRLAKSPIAGERKRH